MRYTIETKGEKEAGLIGIQIAKWQKEGSLEVIERADTIIELQAQLERVAKALEVLKKSGYNSAVMRCYLIQETKLPGRDIDKILASQLDFFRQIGIPVQK